MLLKRLSDRVIKWYRCQSLQTMCSRQSKGAGARICKLCTSTSTFDPLQVFTVYKVVSAKWRFVKDAEMYKFNNKFSVHYYLTVASHEQGCSSWHFLCQQKAHSPFCSSAYRPPQQCCKPRGTCLVWLRQLIFGLVTGKQWTTSRRPFEVPYPVILFSYLLFSFLVSDICNKSQPS